MLSLGGPTFKKKKGSTIEVKASTGCIGSCSEWRCTQLYLTGRFGLIAGLITKFSQKVQIKRVYKLVPFSVHGCQTTLYTAVVLIIKSVAFHISLFYIESIIHHRRWLKRCFLIRENHIKKLLLTSLYANIF